MNFNTTEIGVPRVGTINVTINMVLCVHIHGPHMCQSWGKAFGAAFMSVNNVT